MKITWIVLSLLSMALGASLFVYGGYDDSPGAQLLGLLVGIVGIMGIIRTRKRR